MGFLQKAFCAGPQRQLTHANSQRPNEYGFSTGGEASNECDYDNNPTQLYQLLEMKSWSQAMDFLVEGKYDSSTIDNNVCRIPYNKQVSVWVTRYDRNGIKIRWSHIPLHAAVIFGAPFTVIKKLVELYPDGVRCADDQAMLPLHLAFKHLTNVNSLRLVMNEFPDAIFTKDNRGRLPSDIRDDEISIIIQRVISCATSRIKQQTEDRDTKEITELRKALLEQKREAQVDDGVARRHQNDLQARDATIEVLRSQLEVLRFELQSMEKKSTYSFPFMQSAGHDSNGEQGYQLRRGIELEAENEELKAKVNALQKELTAMNTALQNQENRKNMIRIDDNDVHRFTELSEAMVSERNKYEQEKRKNNVLAAENERMKEEIARVRASVSESYRLSDYVESGGNSGAENRAPTKERFVPQERITSLKMAPVGVGSKDLESFLETRLLKELDIENRRLEKQLAANNNVDVSALLNKQSRLQEMEREVKHFQGNSQRIFGGGVLTTAPQQSTIKRYDEDDHSRRRSNDDAFVDEYNRVRKQASGAYRR
ncbi:unnamed protein product [Cylindrotheca closterium]|uniref:Ankyrin repeat protein n=1 Tax=Cylindrotheca closterium TaxID=2856 RepID=A0AAD2JHL3_9STRA|nr:unnamed protein product [Cylindrotheca closterium]